MNRVSRVSTNSLVIIILSPYLHGTLQFLPPLPQTWLNLNLTASLVVDIADLSLYNSGGETVAPISSAHVGCRELC